MAHTTDLGTSSGEESESNNIFSNWLPIAAASATLFVGVGYTNAFGVFQDYYETTLLSSLPVDQIIVIGSLASSLYLILGAFTGRFADLVGYRISLIIGAGLMIGSMFAASAATEYWHFLLSQGLMFGLGLAFAYMPATTISRQYFGGGKHGFANAIVVSGGALGGCVLPYSVREMMKAYGLPKTFRILGYIAAGILIPSISLLRPKSQPSIPKLKRQPLLDFSLLRNAKFDALVIASTIAMTGFLPRYFLISISAEARGIGPVYASWLLGLMNGLSIFGRIGIGYFADRHGKITALASSFVICGLGHIFFWLPGVTVRTDTSAAPRALLTLFVIFVGIFGSGFMSLFPVVVANMFGAENLASKTGLLNTAIGLSTLAGPSAIYAIVDSGYHARWTAGVLTAGLLMFVGGLLLAITFQIMNKREKKQAGGDTV